MSELRDGELGKVCGNVVIPCQSRITLSSECTKQDYCEHQIADNYDDYLQESEDGCYE
jgi:hypothetical protein